MFCYRNVDKMGDGIRMAWEVGAAEEGIGPQQLFRAGPIGPDFPMGARLKLLPCSPTSGRSARAEVL